MKAAIKLYRKNIPGIATLTVIDGKQKRGEPGQSASYYGSKRMIIILLVAAGVQIPIFLLLSYIIPFQ